MPEEEATLAQEPYATNLVVIVADTFRADHLGCYGNARVRTPSLDKMAAEGVLFTRCYADGLPTIPCRRVLHTGRSIIPMRRKGGWIPLPSDAITLAEVLRGAGFRTGLIADTYHHFAPSMNFHRGFDSWEWIRGQEIDPWRSGPQSAVDPRRHIPEHHWNPAYDRQLRQYLLNTLNVRTEDDYFVARTLDAGLRWMNDNASDGPFMLWLDTFDPHEPWDAPPRFKELYRDDYGLERYLFGYGVRVQDLQEEDLPIVRDLYAAEVSFVDDRLGRLLTGMEALGLLGNTAVLFTSDHGTHVGEEGCVHKTPGLCNSCVSQLPLIMRLPAEAEAGTRVDALVSATDLVPSVLEMLGVSHALKLDGTSYWPLVTGEQDRSRDHVVTEFESFAAVRDLDWAYTQEVRSTASLTWDYVAGFAEQVPAGGPGIPHLWDLRADAGEKVNVVLEHPDRVEWAQSVLRATYAGM